MSLSLFMDREAVDFALPRLSRPRRGLLDTTSSKEEGGGRSLPTWHSGTLPPETACATPVTDNVSPTKELAPATREGPVPSVIIDGLGAAAQEGPDPSTTLEIPKRML